MSDNWTPSTEQVRSHYVFDQSNRWDRERGEAFDRWLAEHDREVGAQAIETARDEIMPPVNWNLRHDGTETPGTAVVDGVYHDVHRELSECADALRSGDAPTPT